MNKTCFYKSPIGWIKIAGTDEWVTSVNFVEDGAVGKVPSSGAVAECFRQLDEYFKGKRKEFTVGIKLEGTDFQKKVWREIKRVPYGQTVSYKEIAMGINNEKAVRAAGGATGSNPFGIIIPCHRIIGSDGKLVGFGGGLWRKEWLLKHEKKFL